MPLAEARDMTDVIITTGTEVRLKWARKRSALSTLSETHFSLSDRVDNIR